MFCSSMSFLDGFKDGKGIKMMILYDFLYEAPTAKDI